MRKRQKPPERQAGRDAPTHPDALELSSALPVTPEEAETRLREAKVVILDRKKDTLPTCSACGCPAYAYDLCFRVQAQDRAQVQALGFTVRANTP